MNRGNSLWHFSRKKAPLREETHQLENWLDNDYDVIAPDEHSDPESRRKIHFTDNNEVIEIFDPNASVVAACPDLNRRPTRSCLKPSSSQIAFSDHAPEFLENQLDAMVLGTSAFASFHNQMNAPPSRALPSASMGNVAPANNRSPYFSLNHRGNIASSIQPINLKPSNLTQSSTTEKFPSCPFPSSQPSQIRPMPEPEKGKSPESELEKPLRDFTNEPAHTDYWEGTPYNRRNRRVNHLDVIFKTNERPSFDKETLRTAVGVLTIVELVQQDRVRYARCFTNSDLPVQIVIVPYGLFPNEELAVINSTWNAALETVEISKNYKSRITFSRVAYNTSLDFSGALLFKGRSREIVTGNLNSNFYSRYVQYYLPLRHTYNVRDGEQLSSIAVGQVAFNRSVLRYFPDGVAEVEGEGWIEPLPGNIGALKNSARRTNAYWILTEPLIETKGVKLHQEDTFSRPDPAVLAEQCRRNKEKEDAECMIKFYSKPMIPIQSIPITPGIEHAKLRLRYCESLVDDLFKMRMTGSKIFEPAQDVLSLFRFDANRKESLKTLAEKVYGYLNNREVFERLKIDEPLVLTRLSQILAWSVYYNDEIQLDLDLHDFVFHSRSFNV